VSCTSASACTAAGLSETGASSSSATLAERWNGTRWVIQSTPNASSPPASFLQGVSCTPASACTTAGYYYNSAGAPATLAERWNGTTWAIQQTPSPGGAEGSFLQGVSCTLTSACTTAGYYYNSGDADASLAERWNGAAWAIQKTPNPGGFGALEGVSCTSASACTATGTYANSDLSSAPLAERWNGTAWAIQKTPNPGAGTSDTYSILDGVSCTSPSACTAAGYYYTATSTSVGPSVTLAERWNGTAWTIQQTPNPGGNGELLGISCTSASACTATGYYYTGIDATVTLAERWNGITWAIQKTPSPGGNGELAGVSCTSASACTAAGYYQTSTGALVTLAERWNGTTWTIQKTPSPGGGAASWLFGVSCTSASACTAAGSYHTGTGAFVTLAERWNGTTWTIQKTPNPGGT
jgi:hypothetical protein